MPERKKKNNARPDKRTVDELLATSKELNRTAKEIVTQMQALAKQIAEERQRRKQ